MDEPYRVTDFRRNNRGRISIRCVIDLHLVLRVQEAKTRYSLPFSALTGRVSPDEPIKRKTLTFWELCFLDKSSKKIESLNTNGVETHLTVDDSPGSGDFVVAADPVVDGLGRLGQVDLPERHADGSGSAPDRRVTLTSENQREARQLVAAR
ncbi:hypothetical protein EYF80_049366 [Liparis tanakae]|uniref:Uncharacterized protein n=1 Tax=Liparis tanakae TaxID=230148 RepID=A0A4Z2FGZ1_9TELE|nr:hypothetical protein EYF80_049366 [Liparis tanakae]